MSSSAPTPYTCSPAAPAAGCSEATRATPVTGAVLDMRGTSRTPGCTSCALPSSSSTPPKLPTSTPSSVAWTATRVSSSGDAEGCAALTAPGVGSSCRLSVSDSPADDSSSTRSVALYLRLRRRACSLVCAPRDRRPRGRRGRLSLPRACGRGRVCTRDRPRVRNPARERDRERALACCVPPARSGSRLCTESRALRMVFSRATLLLEGDGVARGLRLRWEDTRRPSMSYSTARRVRLALRLRAGRGEREPGVVDPACAFPCGTSLGASLAAPSPAPAPAPTAASPPL